MTDNDKKVKAIPYGVSDFEALRQDNEYYVDKTRFLREIEKIGRYIFFIRPRRFGKSLFLSVMESYYDILREDRYEKVFKGTDIFNNPTSQKHSYLILKFNFSAVNSGVVYAKDSFTDYVKEVCEFFLLRYREFFTIELEERIRELKEKKTASDILRFFIGLIRYSDAKLYVIIDEYDNFANTILTTNGTEEYKGITHGEGFFRAFFNVLKEGTSSSSAPISRLFITGVSPVTMDDVTSGFNIGKNMTTEPSLNEMVGFTKDEAIQIITYYKDHDLFEDNIHDLMAVMNTWYNNYLFSKRSKTRLFNSDMVLYFLDYLIRNGSIPDHLIDENVRIDYGNLRHLIVLDRQGSVKINGNFSQLKKIIEDGEVSGEELSPSFPVDRLIEGKDFLSLLFYFGLLTVKEIKYDEPVFCIPNETTRRLYYDYIKNVYEETGTFSMPWQKYNRLYKRMAYHGEWKPLFEYIAIQIKENLSLRDLITGEKSIQSFLNVYLGLDQRYIIHVERELNHGFADIIMEPFSKRYPDIKYTFLLELKYLKKEDVEKKLKPTIKKAEKQIQKYSLDKKFGKSMERFNLIRLVLIFSGPELVHLDSVNPAE